MYDTPCLASLVKTNVASNVGGGAYVTSLLAGSCVDHAVLLPKSRIGELDRVFKSTNDCLLEEITLKRRSKIYSESDRNKLSKSILQEIKSIFEKFC